MKKILVIIGARPQFIKHSSFEIAAKNIFNVITLHTGQHYDENMSEIFFKELLISSPKYLLNLGGGNHGFQTGNMMIAIEKIVETEKPDGIVVYGDTNSTLAGALVAAKIGIPLFHIEAGLRSKNKEMPEEINRVLTDHVSNLLFAPSSVSKKNLKREGIYDGVYVVGDIMKDLVLNIVRENKFYSRKSLTQYYYATIHRPYNTDNSNRLNYILCELNKLSKKVILSLHPRTNNLISKYGLKVKDFTNIEIIPPQAYMENLSYLYNSDGLITDSGGMQKEAYWLEKKCITIRKETEWIETIELGGNTLLFENLENIELELSTYPQKWNKLLYGDGKSSKKIVQIIEKKYKYFDKES